MLVVVGIGVLVFASPNLDAVSDALERGFGRSLLAGIATQLALAPALALLCVGLVLTILGALLIPFAVVAYILAAAGLVTLGLLAIARIGRPHRARRGRRRTRRQQGHGAAKPRVRTAAADGAVVRRGRAVMVAAGSSCSRG